MEMLPVVNRPKEQDVNDASNDECFLPMIEMFATIAFGVDYLDMLTVHLSSRLLVNTRFEADSLENRNIHFESLEKIRFTRMLRKKLRSWCILRIALLRYVSLCTIHFITRPNKRTTILWSL